jgi:hypothetical protein
MDKKTYLSWLQERSGTQQQQVNEIAPLLAAGAGMLARTVATKAVTGAATRALGSGLGQAAANIAGDAVGGVVTNALQPQQTIQEDPPIKKNKEQKKINEFVGPILKTVGVAVGRAALGAAMDRLFGDDEKKKRKSDSNLFTGTPTGADTQSLPAISLQAQSNKTNMATKPTKSISNSSDDPSWWSYKGALRRFAIPGMNESLNKKVNKHVNKFLKSKEGKNLKTEVKEIVNKT